MLKLPQKCTDDKKANAIIAKYLSQNILELARNEILGYENRSGREREDISPDGDYDETDMGYLENFQEFEDAEPEKELSWCVRIECTNSIRQEIPCYEEQLIDKPEELYYYLLEYFEQKEM